MSNISDATQHDWYDFWHCEDHATFQSITVQDQPKEEHVMNVLGDYDITHTSNQGYQLYYKESPVAWFDNIQDVFNHIKEIIEE